MLRSISGIVPSADMSGEDPTPPAVRVREIKDEEVDVAAKICNDVCITLCT